MLARWTFLFVLCLSFSPLVAHAQLDRAKFVRLPPDEQFTFMDTYFTQHWKEFKEYNKQPTQQFTLLSDYQFMRSVANDPKNSCLLRLFWCRNQQYADFLSERPEGVAAVLDTLSAIRQYAHGHDLRAEEGIGWLAWCKAILEHTGKMPLHERRILIYDGAMRGIVLLENMQSSAIQRYHGATYDLIHYLWWMGMYFYRIEEYELALRVITLGNRLANHALDTHHHGYNFYKWQFLNDLGSCHLQLGQLNQAGVWYKRAFEFAKSQGNRVQQNVSYGNLGVILSKQGKYAAAIPHFQQAIATARWGNDRQSEFNATVPLSGAYLRLKQYDNALWALQQAISLYDSVKAAVPDVDSLDMIPLLAGLGEVYQHRGDLKQALYYTQLANRLEEKRRQNTDARIFRQKQEKLEAEAYRARLDQIDADRQRAIWLQYTALGLLALVALGSLLYIGYQHRRRRDAERQLANLIQQARNQTEQLSALQQVQETDSDSHPKDSLSRMAELTQQAILTEADWERFRQSFERVYPNYLMRLRATYPALTPAEIRVVCLSRLSLSTKEMANMLGVSVDTVIKTRYRIRKKANLDEGADLKEAFSNL